jgi:hypothetical protein
MRGLRATVVGVFALAAGFSADAARAEVLSFHAALDGRSGAEPTGSAATAAALIEVDTATQRVSVDMAVEGITVDRLWDRLVAAPAGPIHFHKYATPDGGEAVLVLPVPYGADYRPTPSGLHVGMKSYDYVAGAKLLQSALSFDEFVAAMRGGLVVLNIHTQAFNPGEISGRVVPGRGDHASRAAAAGGSQGASRP